MISCVDVPAQPVPAPGRETGIAVGLQIFLSTADGLVVDNPHPHRKAEKRLAKAPRVVSRRQQGSKRRGKAAACLARRHQTVKRQGADFHHQTALTLLRQHDPLALEDLRVANLVRNRSLATRRRDAGWAQFRRILEATAAYARHRVVAVHPPLPHRMVAAVGRASPHH